MRVIIISAKGRDAARESGLQILMSVLVSVMPYITTVYPHLFIKEKIMNIEQGILNDEVIRMNFGNDEVHLLL